MGVVAVLLLNVFSVGVGALLDIPCMVFHRMCVLCLQLVIIIVSLRFFIVPHTTKLYC